MEMMTPTATQITSVTHSKDLLVIDWADGETSRLDALWLRDHCQMPTSRNPDNGQRLLNVIDIPEDLTIAGVEQLGDEQLVLGVSAGRIDFLHALKNPISIDPKISASNSFSETLKSVLDKRLK